MTPMLFILFLDLTRLASQKKLEKRGLLKKMIDKFPKTETCVLSEDKTLVAIKSEKNNFKSAIYNFFLKKIRQPLTNWQISGEGSTNIGITLIQQLIPQNTAINSVCLELNSEIRDNDDNLSQITGATSSSKNIKDTDFPPCETRIELFLKTPASLEEDDFMMLKSVISQFESLAIDDLYAKIKFWTNCLLNYYYQSVDDENISTTKMEGNPYLLCSDSSKFKFTTKQLEFVLSHINLFYDYIQTANDKNIMDILCYSFTTLNYSLVFHEHIIDSRIFIRPEMEMTDFDFKHLLYGHTRVESADILMKFNYNEQKNSFKHNHLTVLKDKTTGCILKSVENKISNFAKKICQFDQDNAEIVQKETFIFKNLLHSSHLKESWLSIIRNFFNYSRCFLHCKILRINMEIFSIINAEEIFQNLEELVLYNSCTDIDVEVTLSDISVSLKTLDISDFILNDLELNKIVFFKHMKSLSLTIKDTNLSNILDIFSDTVLESLTIFSVGEETKAKKCFCAICYLESLVFLSSLRTFTFVTPFNDTCETHLNVSLNGLSICLIGKRHDKSARRLFAYHFNILKSNDCILTGLEKYIIYEIELFNLKIDSGITQRFRVLFGLQKMKFKDCVLCECTFLDIFSSSYISENIHTIVFMNTRICKDLCFQSNCFFETCKSPPIKLTFTNLNKLYFSNYSSPHEILEIFKFLSPLKRKTLKLKNWYIDDNISKIAYELDEDVTFMTDL